MYIDIYQKNAWENDGFISNVKIITHHIVKLACKIFSILDKFIQQDKHKAKIKTLNKKYNSIGHVHLAALYFSRLIPNRNILI